MRKIFLAVLRFYQRFLSPAASALGAECRFYPSCSAYAVKAAKKYPWWAAVFYISKRVARCGPWSAGGVDDI